MSCKLNQLIQSAEQDQPVCEEPITMEQVSQLESNMFGDMETALTHLDDQTGQSDHLRLSNDQEPGQNGIQNGQDQQTGQDDLQNGVIHVQFINCQDDQQDSHQDDQLCGQQDSHQHDQLHNGKVDTHQENSQDYEVQAVNVTFASSDSDDDDDNHVIIEYEEGGVVTNMSWTLHTPNV